MTALLWALVAPRHPDVNDVPGAADLAESPGLVDLDDVPGAADLTALGSQDALRDERLALLRSDVPGDPRLGVLNQARRYLERLLVEWGVVVVEADQTLEGELSISWCPVEKAAPVLLS